MVCVAVGIFVVLPLHQRILAIKVLVLQLAWDGAGAPGLHIRNGCVDGVVGAVGFRAGGHQNDRVRKRQTRLRQTHHVGGIHRRLDDRNDLRVGKPHILAGAHHQAAAGRGQISRFQQACQIMQCRVRVGAAHGLLVGRNDVVVVVALPVVAHGGAAGDLPDHIQSNALFSVFHRCCRDCKVQTAQRLAQIAPGAFGQIGTGVLVHAHRHLLPLGKALHGVAHPALHIRCSKGLELKHSAAGKQGIIDVKIGVLGGGSNQGDAAVLDAFQKALLLLFVQVLDLVQIQQNAARRCQRADILEHCLDIPGAAGGAVELVQGHAAVLGNNACHRGLSGAGGAVKDHVGDAPALDGAAEHPPRSQQMLLPAHIRQRFGTQALRKRFVHGGFSFPARKALFI